MKRRKYKQKKLTPICVNNYVINPHGEREKMKRTEFYKEYYRITNKIYSDHIIWSPKSKEAEEAWRKGQFTMTSKFGRKVWLVLGYIFLIFCWVPILFNSSWWFVIIICAFYGLSSIKIADYSIIKVERMYHIYKNDSQFSKIVIDSFLYTFVLEPLIKLTKKYISGFIKINSNPIKLKYKAICKDRNNIVKLYFKINKVIIKIDNRRYELSKSYFNRDEMFLDIADIVNNELDNKSESK